ncbi:MAG: serine/threonine protein kinase [Deltaproteobacteria bacterium]|nr:serine/threonine protein kinase [Deltaproteobacteria bacterium]
MEAAGCLDDDTIAAMLEGALAGDRAERARAHITRCDACRRLVSAALEVVGAPPAAGVALTIDGGRSLALTSFPIEGGTSALRAGLPLGTVVAGRYRLERVIGEGGMGLVFAARQLGLDRLVALKVLSARLVGDGSALSRFQREGRLVASLESENVVRIHDLGALETGEPFLAMELLEGEDLDRIAARGPVALPDALAWMRTVCDALGEAHLLGVVHRDIKPSNLFLTRSGKIKVLDFGLAKLSGPVGHTAVTATNVVLGTLGYIAPEQVLGARDVTARADVFALGATLYHLVTGQPPFIDSTFALVMRRIASGALPPMDALRPDLAQVVARCLAKDPASRYANACELGEALAGLASGAPTLSAPPPNLATASLPAPPPIAPIAMPYGPMVPLAPSPPAKSGSGGMVVAIVALVVVGLAALALAGAGFVAYRLSGAGVAGEGGSSGGTTSTSGRRFDEAKLRARLGKAGVKINNSTRTTFPLCDHTTLFIDKGLVELLDCGSSGAAASEKARLERGFANASVKTFDDQVLFVGLPSLGESRALSARLEAP